MSNEIRKFEVEVTFSYEAEVLDGDPDGDWAFADIQKNEIMTEVARILGVIDGSPINVKVTPI